MLYPSDKRQLDLMARNSRTNASNLIGYLIRYHGDPIDRLRQEGKELQQKLMAVKDQISFLEEQNKEKNEYKNSRSVMKEVVKPMDGK